MTTIEPHLFGNRPAVRMANDQVETVIVTGGGHIASITRAGSDLNPLWTPSWKTIDPALRVLADDPAIYGGSGEEGLLSSILGHNLCVDVFGFHSPAEVAAGMTLHGESGMVTWEVTGKEERDGTLLISARLPNSALKIDRVFILEEGSSQVRVLETVTNEAGFERVIARQQHATLDKAFLEPRPALFSCNADRGLTFPEPEFDNPYTFAPGQEFDYPDIPEKGGSTVDWRTFPRTGPSGNLCTLRIRPDDSCGWFVAAQNAHGLAMVYAWEREAYPWLVTWEEDGIRSAPPWNGNEITRGLEFGSWAFPSNRRDIVEMGTLLDTPAFEWLDAYASKTGRFTYGLMPIDKVDEAPELFSAGAGVLESDSVDWVIGL